MDLNRTSIIPIQQRLNKAGLQESRKFIWDDMHNWMEQRQKEWDIEMAQLKNEFFSLKTDNSLITSRRSSDNNSLSDKMSVSSQYCDTGRGMKTFCLTFDVSQFEPEEINVRTQGNSLIVHAKHEEQREKKSISREFNRRVDIPANINPQSLQCFLREDGVLQVETELPSPSYESCSINRDSPSLMENSSVFSDRLSDRDTYSPSRTDRDVCSPPRINWATQNPLRSRDRDVYSPPAIHRDFYNSTDSNKDIYNSLQRATTSNIYNAPRITNEQRTPRDIYTQTGFQQDLYNETLISQPIGSDTFRSRGIDGSINNHSSPMMDQTFNKDPTHSLFSSTGSIARQDEARNSFLSGAVTENGREFMDDSMQRPDDNFSVVIFVGTQFEPHELAVKTVDRKLVVHAQHNSDRFAYADGGDIYREFDLPVGVEPESLAANLTPEGTLIIEAPTNRWPPSSPDRFSQP